MNKNKKVFLITIVIMLVVSLLSILTACNKEKEEEKINASFTNQEIEDLFFPMEDFEVISFKIKRIKNSSIDSNYLECRCYEKQSKVIYILFYSGPIINFGGGAHFHESISLTPLYGNDGRPLFYYEDTGRN